MFRLWGPDLSPLAQAVGRTPQIQKLGISVNAAGQAGGRMPHELDGGRQWHTHRLKMAAEHLPQRLAIDLVMIITLYSMRLCPDHSHSTWIRFRGQGQSSVEPVRRAGGIPIWLVPSRTVEVIGQHCPPRRWN